MNKMNSIPLLNFPTKLIFVDDNKAVLNSYKLLSIYNKIDCYHNQLAALSMINKLENYDSILSLYNQNNINDAIILDKNIFDFIKHQDKYNYISQVIVDYKMPQLDGITFCKEILNSPILTTLLTAEFEPIDAIKALNNKYIDYYIEKGKPELDKELLNIIALHQKLFFSKLMSNIKIEVLHDKSYMNLFDKITNKYNPKEYYLYTKTGSYIILNDSGYFLFNVFTDSDLDYIMQMLVEKSKGYNAIKNREKIPSSSIFADPSNIMLNNFNQFEQYYYNVIPLSL